MNTSITSLFRINKDVPDGEIWFVCDQGFYKEDKMDENISKSINRIEGRILELVTYMDKFLDTLKELVPKAIEEKKIELEDGQIYKLNRPLTDYYLLHCDYHDYPVCSWSLMNLKTRNSYWIKMVSPFKMKNTIKEDFTLCPNAEIDVCDPGDIHLARSKP